MLYYLFEYLEKEFQFPGASLIWIFNFQSCFGYYFVIANFYYLWKRIISFLQKETSW